MFDTLFSCAGLGTLSLGFCYGISKLMKSKQVIDMLHTSKIMFQVTRIIITDKVLTWWTEASKFYPALVPAPLPAIKKMAASKLKPRNISEL